jgi:hypothetical protein
MLRSKSRRVRQRKARARVIVRLVDRALAALKLLNSGLNPDWYSSLHGVGNGTAGSNGKDGIDKKFVAKLYTRVKSMVASTTGSRGVDSQHICGAGQGGHALEDECFYELLQDVGNSYSPTPAPSFTWMEADKLSLPDPGPKVKIMDMLPPEALEEMQKLRAHLETAPSPPSDAPMVFGVRRAEYPRVLNRMHHAGLLGYMPVAHSRARVGPFARPKDDGKQRGLADARAPNLVMLDPPSDKHRKLSLVSPDVFRKVRMRSGHKYYVSKIDLDSYFLTLLLPEWLHCWFCLPPVHSSTIEGWEGPPQMVSPYFLVLPPGFSWAPWLSQMVHLNHLLVNAGIPKGDLLTPETTEFELDRPRHGVYLDDMITISPYDHTDLVLHLLDCYTRHNLKPKASKLVMPTTEPVQCLGVMLDPTRQVMYMAPESLVKLSLATNLLLRAGECTPAQLSSIVGKWTWPCLIVRPALSVFQHVYRFMSVDGFRRRRVIWSTVKRELATMVDLAPLLVASLTVNFFQTVMCTDACETGFGVCASPMQQPHENVVPYLLQPWRTIIAAPWKRKAHINTLELHAVLTMLKWVISCAAYNATVVSLCDSNVVISVVNKGRSSSATLLRVMRSIAAHCLWSGVVLRLLWVPTEVNPADEPSRRFQV